jgi:RNA polymerase sigma-70 factor (ECF subfamily)
MRLLSPGYRQVFNLFVIEGLSHEDISEKLGISVGTSKSNLSKAREKMRKIILQLIRIKLYA